MVRDLVDKLTLSREVIQNELEYVVLFERGVTRIQYSPQAQTAKRVYVFVVSQVLVSPLGFL